MFTYYAILDVEICDKGLESSALNHLRRYKTADFSCIEEKLKDLGLFTVLNKAVMVNDTLPAVYAHDIFRPNDFSGPVACMYIAWVQGITK